MQQAGFPDDHPPYTSRPVQRLYIAEPTECLDLIPPHQTGNTILYLYARDSMNRLQEEVFAAHPGGQSWLLELGSWHHLLNDVYIYIYTYISHAIIL